MPERSWRRYVRPMRANLRADIDEELRFHIEMLTQELVAEGWPAPRARAEAERRFGAVAPVRDACFTIDQRRHRRARLADTMSFVADDLRFGARMLRRSTGFSILAVLCLTLGIGANAAVYSWVEGILLRPYPAVAHQERLYVLVGTDRATPGGHDGMSWPDFVDLRRSSQLVEAFIADKICGALLSGGDRADWVSGSVVSSNYFDAIGVRPILGRGFMPNEETGRNGHPVIVIAYQIWKERFGGASDVIGKKVDLNGVPFTIIGVAPREFVGTFVGYAFQFWVPASMQEVFDPPKYKLEDRGQRWIEPFVLLKPGVTAQQAEAELSAVTDRLAIEFPLTNRGRGVTVVPLWQSPFNGASRLGPTLRIALFVVSFVLLIACANVANLLLVRSFARRREMTIRLALGASRGRLITQLLTEGTILAVLAAAGGLLVAYWCRNAMVLFYPPRSGVPFHFPAELDWRVLTTSAVVCIGATLLFGLVPALVTSNVDLAGAMKSDAAGVVGARGRSWVRSSLVLVQMSLSFLLLVGAVLLSRSLRTTLNASPGFSQDVIVTALSLPAAYDSTRARHFQDDLLQRVQAFGGVESAAFGRVSPFSNRNFSSAPIAVDGYVPPVGVQPAADYNEVGPGYLSTLGIPLVAGREFTTDDDERAPLVAIVNEPMAAQYWPNESPLGKRLVVGGRPLRVIGIAKAAKYRSFGEGTLAFFYVPLRQSVSREVALNIRSRASAGTLAPQIRQAIRELDATVAPLAIITLRDQVVRSTTTQRMAVTLLSVFGGLALLLAAIGLYGVMSYLVSQSTGELGLRMALGASGSDVLRFVLSHGMALTTLGIGLGALAALGSTRLMGDLLYRVSPRDPIAFASALGLMMLVAIASCLAPGIRAARLDPIRALRRE